MPANQENGHDVLYEDFYCRHLYHRIAAGRTTVKARFLAMLIVGVLFSLIGAGLVLGGIGAYAVQDDDGYISSPVERFAVDSRAITFGRVEGLRNEDVPGPLPFDVGNVRIRAESVGEGKEIFIGIAPQGEVKRYLSGSNYSELLEVNHRPFRAEYEEVEGSAQPGLPMEQGFWVASASGSGQQDIDWNIQPGNWSVVLMNGDATPGLAVDLQAGFSSELLGPIAVGLLIGGTLLLVSGVPLLIFGAIGLGRQQATPSTGPASRMVPPQSPGQGLPSQGPGVPAPAVLGPALPEFDPAGGESMDARAGGGSPPARSGYSLHRLGPGGYPSMLRGELDPVLSRWKWLVKWFLAIPHFIVLFFLWFAFVVVTITAGFAILFTGRYPRSLFYFNVGVLRWNWRVAYYAYAALGTDRYPPFTLAKTDYPADFDAEYPEQLSRGLVLVKWWLLSIPHLLIVAAITGSSTIRWTNLETPGLRYETGTGLSLVGVLVLIAGVTLLFTGRYVHSLFDLILGLNRWIYRTITYTALMRDEYPPFRLDQGPTEQERRGADGVDPGPPPA
ncbi:DUF4389 domain-containing protein [Pseudarthrobacter sp. NPDC092439]|uniref:DUF4389 domain-containing protein n=1 Tax=unclassified Pseudarthrobacter TaxID=2647000 RepID=UPI003806AFC5